MGQTAFPYQAVRGLPAQTLAARNAATAGPLGTVSWAAASTGHVLTVQGDGTVAFAAVSAGITSLNGLTDATQAFAVGTTGTNVAFSSAAGIHTLNIPDASTTARGVVTTGTQGFSGVKTFHDNVNFGITVHYEIRGNQSRSGINHSLGFITGATHGGYKWTGGNMDSVIDLVLERDAADRMGQRRSTNPQALGVYNTYTSATSYERLNIAWASNICTIEVTAGSAGGTLRGLKIGGAVSSLIGFYGATPVDQPDTIADPAGGGTIDAEARTAINTIIDRLQELGLIA